LEHHPLLIPRPFDARVVIDYSLADRSFLVEYYKIPELTVIF